MSIRVLFFATGLQTGGAEKQLLHLTGGLAQKGFSSSVVALRDGPVAEEIRSCGVSVEALGVSGFTTLPGALYRLAKVTRAFRPDIVQGWMYHGNLAASFARRFAAPQARLVWGVRQSLYDLRREKPLTRQAIRLSARMSRNVQAIVYNSHTARTQHEAAGFVAARGCVIDNGFDTARFAPDPVARKTVREWLRLTEHTPLIGLIARYHPMKGHDVFLQAAARLAHRRPDVHFLLVGREVFPDNPALAASFSAPALAGRVHCLGERGDVARLTAALDIASSSSSWGEAFPNAVGEAMSCGVPVVATEVGDVRRIVGEAGIVVPPGDVEGLARAWETLLDDPERRRQMGQAGRGRVQAQFSLEAMAARYRTLYEELLHDG